MDIFTIGKLAQEAGIPTSTIRYYERVGLLQPECRSSGNYRMYTSMALEQLRFIRAAQATGFTLDDVTALLHFRDGKTAPCKEVQALIEERLADTEQRLADLQHVQHVLTSSLKLCRRSERQGRCRVMEDLSFTLLLGLEANASVGLWWADPVAALLMTPWLVKEGREDARREDEERIGASVYITLFP